MDLIQRAEESKHDAYLRGREEAMRELEKYKEAYRLACHNLILAQNNVIRSIRLFDENLNLTKEYFDCLEDTQKTYLEMAEENLINS